MRTTKRFTPAVMRRWERNKRSEGTYSEYQPWHQITRDDPPSHGQSRIKSSAISARQHSFLSKIEFHAYCCLTLMANVKDVREQYRLSPLTNTHEQCAYGALDCNVYEGTIDVARRLGFKHPTLFSKGEHEPWRMTTDFLCLVSDNNKSHLLAISVKPSLRELDERDKQLLKIEREYWRIRNVEWQLLTESCFSKSVRLGLSFLQAWALHEYRVPQEQQRRVAETLRSFQCISFAHAVNVVANGNTEQAQRAIMQAVWSGHLWGPLVFRAI